MLEGLPNRRPDLEREQRQRLARQFARVYCVAAYRNAEMIEKTIRSEGFDCDYSRSGWVQGQDALGQEGLEASVKMGRRDRFHRLDFYRSGGGPGAQRDAGGSSGRVFAGGGFPGTRPSGSGVCWEPRSKSRAWN